MVWHEVLVGCYRMPESKRRQMIATYLETEIKAKVIAQPIELGAYRRFIYCLGRFSMGKPCVLHVLPNLSGQKKPETRIFPRLSNYKQNFQSCLMRNKLRNGSHKNAPD